MTPAVVLLDELRSLGATAAVVNGRLRIEAPRGTVSPELRQALTTHKPELLALLTAPKTEARLDPIDYQASLLELYAEIRAEYEAGALPWAFERCPELKRRFDETETAIDRLAGQRPTEAEFRSALAAHAAIWRELLKSYRAHEEREGERADPMPELPEDTAAAIGVSYGDREPGTWDVVRQGRKR